jgi:hypothetical protein
MREITLHLWTVPKPGGKGRRQLRHRMTVEQAAKTPGAEIVPNSAEVRPLPDDTGHGGLGTVRAGGGAPRR